MNNNELINNIPKSVIDWLRKNIETLYKIDPRTTFHDSLLALSLFKQILRPRTRVFTDSEGRSHLLLCLYGKFRIQTSIHNNSNDNMYEDSRLDEVPVLIWIDNHYPLTHPLCYLDLEQIGKDWMINVGKHVDSNGQIYLPFFKDWNDKDSNYNIINTVNSLQNIINNEVLLRRRQPLLPPKVRDIDTVTTGGGGGTSTINIAVTPPPIPERPKLPKIKAGNILQTDTNQEEGMKDLMDTDIISMNLSSSIENKNHQQQINEISDLLRQLDIMEEKKINQVEDIKLNEINETIRQFQATLTYEMDQIDTIKSQLKTTQDLLTSKMKELDQMETSWSKRYKRISEILLIDGKRQSLQITETLGLNQLYDLVAEDMALDDTISVLNELLNKKRITMDIFIRKTRDLAKRQFMIRLNIEKIYDMLND